MSTDIAYDAITQGLLDRAHDHLVMGEYLKRGGNPLVRNRERHVQWRREQAHLIMSHMLVRGKFRLVMTRPGFAFTDEQVDLIEDIARYALSTYDSRRGHYDFWADVFADARTEKRWRDGGLIF